MGNEIVAVVLPVLFVDADIGILLVASPMRDYEAIAGKYVDDVLAGRILACDYVRAACQRQKDDLVRFADGSRFVFDPSKGNRICHFIEHLTHVKGELAGKNIRLEPWQAFILHTAFAWVSPDGHRRFRRVYIEVGRGNGKSCLSSGVALYCLCADQEPGAEVYSFATTRDQAKIVFCDAKQMAAQNKDLREAFGLQVLANALAVPATNSSFQAKSAEGSTLDGLNTHLAVVDELHAHKRRDVYDVVETSLGKRRDSLMWVITTAGFDSSGICYEVRGHCVNVLNKTTEDDTQFCIIFTADEDDDWTSDAALMKANPNWGVSVNPEMITALRKKAMALPSAVNNFKTKHLDIWCSAAEAWMDMQAWNRCTTEVSLDEFEGQPCWIGLDLGAKNDLTAKVLVFPRDRGDGKREFVVFGDYFAPKTALEKAENSQYEGWETLGFLHVSEGAVTDFEAIDRAIREDLSRFDVQGIAYDPWQMTQLASSLAEDGAPMIEYRNTVQNMSDPMKWLEALVLDGRLLHCADPVLAWMMGNVVAKRDFKDNIFPRKERYENKIDGVIATIMALGLCVGDEDSYEYGGNDAPVFFEW